ncbi:MAG: S41 family peptidase, partial [Thermoanaerobaculia bacterium]
MRLRSAGPIALLAVLLSPYPASAASPTKMLTQPALSAERVAFVYGNDLWTARLDGTMVQRITSGPGVKSNPAFSPDGSLLAFSAELDGNLDAFVVPAAGGVPKRLTWHPSRDTVQAFTPDGKAVLFSSPREATNNRHDQLYTVPVGGGVETKLPIPYASRAIYSPDGKTIAYTPNRPAHVQWKRYRGGTVSRIWLYDVATHAVVKVPQPDGRCNDLNPTWVGDTLYLTSDRDGEFNVYAFDAKSKSLSKVTAHDDFPVLHAAAANGKVVYEQAGLLHLLDAATKKAAPLPITVNADLLETRPRWAKGAKWVREGSVSPSGARVALEFRGEIVTVPAEKGDPRYLTATPGAHERGPAWSPDGKEIAYLSDESGEYEIVVSAQDGKGTPKRIKVPGSGFYDRLTWSPDAKKIALTDNSWALWVVDL